jgi:hypothetical protein
MSKKPSTKKTATKKAPAKPAAAPKTSAKPAPAKTKAGKRDPAVCIKTGGAHSWTEDQDGEYCIECLDPKPKGKKAQPAKTEKTGDAPRSQLTAEENDKLVAARKAKATKAAKPAKAKADAADKKLSAIDAAVQVLAGSKEPLNTKQMIEAMAAKGLWTSPGGKTPHATLYSAILREINEKGKDARFTKTERGRFTINA